MSQKLKDFLKPSLIKITLTIIFIAWQYFYFFSAIKIEFLEQLSEYIIKGLGLINWNDYFIRLISLAFIWVIVALLIFFVILIFEKVSIGIANAKLKRKYVNQPKENYAELLKERQLSLKKHFFSHMLLVGSIILIFVSLFFIADQIERFRFWALDSILWNIQESGEEVNFESIAPLAVSFVTFLPVWYLISCVHVWTFKESRVNYEEEEIAEKHSTVVIESTDQAEES